MRVNLDMHLDTARVLLEQAEHGHEAGIGGELSAEAPRELADAIRVAEDAEKDATPGG
jgi:hypothetical protein